MQETLITRDDLKKVSFLKEIEEYFLDHLLLKCSIIEFEEGDIVFKEGDKGDKMYIILSGKVEVIKNSNKIGELRKDDFFGEMALISDMPRNATIKTLQKSKFIVILHDDISMLLENNLDIAEKISDAVIARRGDDNY